MSFFPDGARFGLFLSHDVDQIHDRGIYRTLGDINHLRRTLIGTEAGRPGLCLRRIIRSVTRPKAPERQFERILEIEARHSWRSTFFMLEGRRWARYGARYRLLDERVRRIARLVLDAGCEIGIHGGYYDFNQAAPYRRSADRAEAAFGVRPIGIRNHFLRLSIPETWRAQAEAGYSYDATFGWNERVGFRDDQTGPFEPMDPETGRPIGLVVLPLAAMDSTLFRALRLTPEEALRVLDRLLIQTEAAGGVLSILWHNNFFDEPEYEDWESVYVEFLARAALRRPYCAPGAEIVELWSSK